MAILLGDKNLSVIEEVVLTSSQTYTARRTGIADVICIGGGGQGGSSGVGNVGATKLNTTGGGPGGYSRKRIPITSGDTFTVVVGAGGQASSTKLPGASNLTAGSNGGESTFDHASATATIALDSNGGVGGLANVDNSAGTYAGGAGGTATGGDVNFTGGRGGSIIRGNNAANNSGAFTTGGGAVAVHGTAFNGGDVNFTSGGTTAAATGGAGIGGNGGNIAYQVGGSSTSTSASGGGSASGEGNGFTATHTDDAGSSALTAFAKTDVVMGGGRLPSHGGQAGCTNSSVNCIAGNGGTGALRAVLAGLGDTDYNSIYGGNDKPTEVHDAAAFSFDAGVGDAGLARYPQPTGPGGGGGGACGDAGNNASNSVIAAGNGAAFAGGGGACSLVSSSELASSTEKISSSGRGGIGGGGSGAAYLGCNVANATIEWASGGDGVVIIQYLG